MFEVNYIFKEGDITPTHCFGITNAGIYFFLTNHDNDPDFGFFPPSPTRHLNLKQLILIFPEAIEYFKFKLKEKIQELNNLNELNKKAIKRFDIVIANKWYDSEIKELKKEINSLEKLIKEFSTGIFLHNKNNNDIINKNLIDRIKQIPISNFIDFKGRVAKSIWNPTEKTPSMYYYVNNNRVHCFSTNNNGDVIDVIRITKNITFSEAVKFLSKYI